MPGSATEREAVARAAFARQAEWAERLGSPFMARLCALLGERLDRGSETGRRVLDWPGDPDAFADALPLRLCGGLHALVRAGEAPALADYYPPAALPEPDRLWSALEPVLDDPALPPWLDRAPQTNEVGRSAPLMAGLLVLARTCPHPVELSELGASAGLNLNLDRYAFRLGGREAGDPRSPLRLEPEWRGEPPPAAPVVVAGRRGCDLAPVDPVREGERLLAYVWPDQPARLAQLEAALRIAAAQPPEVDRAEAADWIEARLARLPERGMTRAVFHSIAWQYFPAGARARIVSALEGAGATATAETPLAWVRYEHEPESSWIALRLRTWPGGEERLLATGHPHGRAIRWLD